MKKPNSIISKLFITLLALTTRISSHAADNLSNYKDLSEEITSESYILTRIKPNAAYGVGWDEDKHQFVVGDYYSGFRIFQDGHTENMGIKEREGDKYGTAKQHSVNLRNFFIENGMTKEEILDHLEDLYKSSSVFHYEGKAYRSYYFESDGAWHYLNNFNRKHFEWETFDAIEKFPLTHNSKGHFITPLSTNREPQSDFNYDWKNKDNIIRLDAFEKTHIQSSVTAYLPQVPTEALGIGYYSLTHNNEELKFRAYTEKKIFGFEKYWSHNFIYLPPEKARSAVALLMISDPMNHNGNNGIYLVRPKK